MPATDRFLAIPESVENVFLHLDELSLVRVQGVNCSCRAVVMGSVVLKRRLGSLDVFEDVIDNNRRPLPQDENHVRWNPLLDWFSMRCFGEPLFARSFNKPCDVEITTFLPHASHAALSPVSGIYDMSVTLPPVKHVSIVLPTRPGNPYTDRFFRKEVVPSKDRGVSIGDVLCEWANSKISPNARDPMLSLYVCPPNYLELADDQYQRRTGYSDVSDSAMCIVEEETDAMQDRIDELSQVIVKCPSYRTVDNPLFANDLWILRRWSDRIEGTEPPWHNAAKDKQDAVVTAFFNAYKRIWKELMCEATGVNNLNPFWPALAMPAKEGDGLELMWKPYEVDYASGLVFNRQEVDPKYIRLPFK